MLDQLARCDWAVQLTLKLAVLSSLSFLTPCLALPYLCHHTCCLRVVLAGSWGRRQGWDLNLGSVEQDAVSGVWDLVTKSSILGHPTFKKN